MKKYNLALRPTHINDTVTALATLMDIRSESYLLGESSLPHVTLYQFWAEDNEIRAIIKSLHEQWQESYLALTFAMMDCRMFADNLCWIALMPEQKKILNTMHEWIAQIIHRPKKSDFDPHMTLLNTKNRECEMIISELTKSYLPLTDQFILTLGKCDDVGQYTEVICTFIT